jgi:hypothetical protein
VTSSKRLPAGREAWRDTLDTGTPARAAILLRMAGSCKAKAAVVRLNCITSWMSLPYLHLYPATHLQWDWRLDWGALYVLTGQRKRESPAQ